MVISPLLGADKAWENTRPQIADAVNSILSSLGLKSILDAFGQQTQTPEFKSIMPFLGMGMNPIGGGGFMEAIGRGGGASNISAPSQAIKAAVHGAPAPQGRSLEEAIKSTMPLMKDQTGIQHLSDLLKMITGGI